MAITIESSSFPNLTAQPFGYEETDTRNGLTARKWELTGLLTPSEYVSLVNTYNTWKTNRIQDPDSLLSETVGTTVAFSGNGPGGIVWTDIDCWFTKAPEAEQVGAYLSTTIELVDADQALEVLLKQEEKAQEEEETSNFGTITIGTTVLTLLKPVDAYGPGPTLQLTPTGSHFISGPLVVYKIKDVEGTTTLDGWNDIRTWYESQIVAVPSVGSYFPITSPTATAEKKIVGGVKTTVYTVSIQLGLVR